MVSSAGKKQQGEDDAALIVRAINRDKDAVSIIMARYNRRLFRIARSILKNDEDAEDALQAAYLRAFTNLAAFRHEAGLGTWLTRILINVALGYVRSQRAVVRFDETGNSTSGATVVTFPGNGVVDPERAMAQRQIRAVLEAAIDDLPNGLRTVLVARTLEGMSVEETSEALGITPQAVKTRLHRARQTLRKTIERRMGPVLTDAFPFDGWRCRRMTELVLNQLGLDAQKS